MKTLFALLTTATIYGVFYYWKKDPVIRNLSVLMTVVLLLIFNSFNTNNEVEEDTVPDEELEQFIQNPIYDYRIVKRETEILKDSAIGDFRGYFVYAVTDEPLNKAQIKELLYKIKEETEDEKMEEDLYILLYENETIANEGYSLGRLADLKEGMEIDARQKDWDKQPSEEEYKIYREFIEDALAEESLKTEEELAENVSKEREISVEEVLEIVEKVEKFMASDQSVID